jgi:hypothetical protein
MDSGGQMSRRLAIFWAVLCATLVFPQTARAGLGDIIWEMSGPQMVGGIIRCRMPFGSGKKECGIRVLSKDTPPNPEVEHVWFAFEGGVYVSTGQNSGGTNYTAGSIWMFAFEPMLEFRYDGDISAAYDRPRDGVPGVGAVYGGVGPLINRFLVKGDTPAFTKYGIKLRPIAIAWSGWAIEYNVRLYPDGFTPDQFGFGPPMDINREFEAVQSISVSVPWKPKWKFMR